MTIPVVLNTAINQSPREGRVPVYRLADAEAFSLFERTATSLAAPPTQDALSAPGDPFCPHVEVDVQGRVTTLSQPVFTRRALLGSAMLLPLTGCMKDGPPAAAPPASTPTAPSASTTDSSPAQEHRDHLARLERKFDARLGVFALATGTGAKIAHRADDRFAFCSTLLGLAVAAGVERNPLSHLDRLVEYTEGELMRSSLITRRNVATGMSIRQLCDAAIRYSDGTAGNLLLREIGGPAGLTTYARSLGDPVTRADRVEPVLAEGRPGDRRDTTSPRALGADYRKLVLGGALAPRKRAVLRDLLVRNTTGDERIRAGVPRGWTVADKTGTGGYGTINDIAVVWPPKGEPLLIAIMSRRYVRNADYDEALIADTAEYVVTALTLSRPAR